MTRISRQKLTKTLALCVMLMGLIHIAATFTPLIADKHATLPDESRDVVTYFSLMCGALPLLGGYILYTFVGKLQDHPFLRKPYILALALLNIDGILAVCFMRSNPFAWIIYALAMALLFANVTRVRE